MRQLKLKYAKATNFLCFGPEGIELNFAQYGPIVVVQSRNLDVLDENGKAASNGVGKSSLPEIIVYALYGKTIKKPKKMTHSDIINFQSGKELTVELRWDDYRVIRTRIHKGKQDSGTLKLWKSADEVWDETTEITAGGIPATQQAIDGILGLSYDAFVNIFIFTDDISTCFLECDGPTKREIVENLLALDKYRGYVESAKELLKGYKDDLKLLAKDYDFLLESLESGEKRVQLINGQEKDWRKKRRDELAHLSSTRTAKEAELAHTDEGQQLQAYRKAQEEISELEKKLPEYKTAQEKIAKVLADVQPRYQQVQESEGELDRKHREIAGALKDCLAKLDEHNKIVLSIQQKGIKECPYCESALDETKSGKILLHASEVCARELARKKELEEAIAIAKNDLNEGRTLLNTLSEGIMQARQKSDSLATDASTINAKISALCRIKAPDVGAAQLLLESQITELNNQIHAKEREIDGHSPYADLLRAAVQEVADKKAEAEAQKKKVQDAEDEIPYYEFWVKAFGDTGIRKYVIDGIIPALNARVAYWLQYLIDSRIKLEFNNKLEEKIDRYPFKGRPYVYHGMSGGQRRRLNLTISQSFAYIRELNSGASPSLVWLDEVTMNMDQTGVLGIYRMICELAKDKQVFVIDHNQELLQLLDGCDTISLEMKDEITRMV